MGGGSAEVVTGHADEAGQALVARREDGLGRATPLVEHLQARDAVELVEVEVVDAEQLERRLELGPGAVSRAAMRLAGHEQPIAHRWDERTEVALRRAVGGRDVEVVDAARHRIGEALLGLGGRAGPEGRTSQDGDGALVAGPAETSTLHGPIVPDGGHGALRPPQSWPDDRPRWPRSAPAPRRRH